MVDLKPIKRAVQESNLLLRRWATLGLLVLAVGAVAVWGGLNRDREEPQGASGLLMEQLQARIGADVEGETVVEPASGGGVYRLPDDMSESMSKNVDESVDGKIIDEKIVDEKKDEDNAPEQAPAGGSLDVEPQEALKEAADEVSDKAPNNAQNEAPEDEEEVYDYAPDPWLADAALSAEAKLLKMLPPVSGGELSRGFGYNYDPTFRDYRFHGGLDIEASVGAAVLCPLGAEVAEIRDDGFGGQVVVLEHGDKLVSQLSGLVPAAGLAVGDKLAAGDKLGEIGDPPLIEDVQPAHLHWELLLNGEPVDAGAYGYGE